MEQNEAGVDVTTPSETRIRAGAESYRRQTLAVYDLIVLGLVSRWVWRCSRRTMLRHYNGHVGGRHLDLGPGTGWFLDRCRFPTARPSITLLDLNEVVLATAAERIARYQPEVRTGDVFKPLRLDGARFDSVGMNFLLHCLPGTMRQKAVVFDHLRPVLAPGAQVFGSTVLGVDAPHTALSGRLLRRLNHSEVFHNTEDRQEEIAAELEARFTEVQIRRRGVVCLFSARHAGA
jgi:ubiquinone/menaquinone biosynthesis C-methylase UbiE